VCTRYVPDSQHHATVYAIAALPRSPLTAAARTRQPPPYIVPAPLSYPRSERAKHSTPTQAQYPPPTHTPIVRGQRVQRPAPQARNQMDTIKYSRSSLSQEEGEASTHNSFAQHTLTHWSVGSCAKTEVSKHSGEKVPATPPHSKPDTGGMGKIFAKYSLPRRGRGLYP
jgi:hypothetical protein